MKIRVVLGMLDSSRLLSAVAKINDGSDTSPVLIRKMKPITNQKGKSCSIIFSLEIDPEHLNRSFQETKEVIWSILEL